MSWNSDTADATTVITLMTTGGNRTVTLTGVSGVTTFAAVLPTSGQFLRAQYSAGTAPGNTIVMLWQT